MIHYIRRSILLIVFLFGATSTFGQSDQGGADVSGALAAIQAKQNSANASTQPQQAFPALKAQSCKEAVPYVESRDGLFGEWDRAMEKYKADQQGLEITGNARKELLSDAYWRTSTAADVANEVRYLCNVTRHTLAV